jgi:transposase
LNADETTHRMLEGDERSGWYLWGFSTPTSCFFECHDTRSGDVASAVLLNSNAEYLVSDVYSGYAKAVREANKVRKEKNLPQITNVYCNAHARRYFKESDERFQKETKFYIEQYRRIYRLEGLAKKHPELSLKIRTRMLKYFEKMKTKAMADLGGYSLKSGLGKAMNYFLKNYDGLTVFLKLAAVPIDNNSQERLLRNPVIGRKTWYGTHSKRGAETAAVLFSIVESCKLNDVNPREFFKQLVEDLHQGLEAFTPYEYKNKFKSRKENPK